MKDHEGRVFCIICLEAVSITTRYRDGHWTTQCYSRDITVASVGVYMRVCMMLQTCDRLSRQFYTQIKYYCNIQNNEKCIM